VVIAKIENRKSKIEYIDTHCHINDSDFADKYDKSQDQIIKDAKEAGVKAIICVGTDVNSSQQAINFARNRENCYASLAIHPHEVANTDLEKLLSQIAGFNKLLDENSGGIVAIGECGLDYYYHQAETIRKTQKLLLRSHIELAMERQLPLIFHIRNPDKEIPHMAKVNTANQTVGIAFNDLFEIIDDYQGIRGVVHSFSAGIADLKGCLDRGLYIGLNGIMTFSKQKDQLESARMVPLEKLVLETDAPFLTPAPFRGTMCEPKHVRVTAEFLSELRGENLETLARVTTQNAQTLFGI
jgi:TatD DNase family protein